MEITKQFDLLVCGDSYMALDPRPSSDRNYNFMHWTVQLPKHIKVHNYAQPGASNALILRQLQTALLQQVFDGIVLGFTSVCRIEVAEKTTTVHPWLDLEQKQLGELYRKNIDLTNEILRNAVTAEYAVLLARQHAPTVFSLNELDIFLSQDDYDQLPRLLNLKKNQMPMLLTGHREFGDPTDDDSKPWASFHVSDPQVHIDYAKQITKHLDQLHKDPI